MYWLNTIELIVLRLKIRVANGPHSCVITKSVGTAPKPKELRKLALQRYLVSYF